MFTKNVRRVALVGTGFVGMSFAYSLMNQGGADELVLIDLDVRKTEGEAMDLNHGVAFAPSNMKVWAGTYADCQYADIVVITAGAAQAPGETRLDLTAKNTKIMKSIVEQIMKNGFNGIMVVASNPVDILSYVAWKASGLDKNRVFGTGTLLDTARLRYMIGQYIDVDSRNIHAYMLAEHGDSSFVPWTNVSVGPKPLLQMIDETPSLHMEDLQGIYEHVRDAAYEIIARKKATYYGIGMSLTRIVKAIFNDENSVLALSVCLTGEYGHDDVYIGVPAVINRLGIREIINIDLNEVDQGKFDKSVNEMKAIIDSSVKPYL